MSRSKNFTALQKEVATIIANSKVEEDPVHSKLALNWLLKINPEASEEQKIAILAHDIERGVAPRTKMQDHESYESYKQRHADRSARITAELMKNHNYSEESIEKVKQLIEKHEVGGTLEENQIRDADSISYFEYNINFYLKAGGSEETKKKIKFMFSRASPEAKLQIKKMKFNDKIKRIFNASIK